MENTPSNESRFVSALSRLWKTVLVGLSQRLDLFSMELEEEKRRILTVIIVSLVAAFSAFVAFLCLNLVVILISWDGNRVLVALSMAAFYLVLAGAAALWIRHRFRTTPPPFAASLEEFRKDCASITSEDA
jgi:uncharacterized membrane protein YqjE